MSNNLITPLIIDNGSQTCKAGFVEYDLPGLPKYVCPTIVGRQVIQGCQSQLSNNEFYIGEEVQQNRDKINNIKHPIEYGQIFNWEDMERTWNHIFNKLQVVPKEHPVLLTEALPHLRASREIITQIMFETFETPAIYVAVQAVLSLFASGRTTGTVYESGDGCTQPISVYEGNRLSYSLMRFFFAGHDFSAYMGQMLKEKGYSFEQTTEKDIMRDIKESLCYVALDFEKELSTPVETLEKSYKLPGGQVIKLDKERFKCGEAIFQPNLLGLEVYGITETIYNSIMKSDPEIRKLLFSNIVLGGGNTMFPNIAERLHKEITAIAPSHMDINIIAPSERKYSAWVGGSIMASLSTFKDICITQSEYDEFGPSIVHRKCF